MVAGVSKLQWHLLTMRWQHFSTSRTLGNRIAFIPLWQIFQTLLKIYFYLKLL